MRFLLRIALSGVCCFDPAVQPLEPAAWPLYPAVWPPDPAAWPLDPVVLPLDLSAGGGCGFSGIEEMVSFSLLSVCLHIGGFVLVGWSIWHVGVLLARHHLHGEVVVCVACRMSVVSVVSAVAVLAT